MSRRFLASLGALMLAAPATSVAADLALGQRIYQEACASCHGPQGRPDPASPALQGFDPLPADLSDPLFNSREPALDWELVVKHGGRALGLSPLMPPWDAAYSDEEIASVVAYVKSLADTRGFPPGELNLMLPVRTKKAYPEDEVVWVSRYTSRDGQDVWRNVLEFEKRIGRRGQGILELVQEDTGTRSDLTAVEVGYKHALLWDLERAYILSGAVVMSFPTDGRGSESLNPYLAFARELSPRATLQTSARAKLPFDDVDLGDLELAGVVHWVWSDWPQRVFPGLEFTARAPFQSTPGRDSVLFSVVPQARIGLTRGGHVALNLGAEFPLNRQDYDYRGFLTLLWDFADGSFFQGWGR
jgi:mono/diheme cytochrome c family protein